ncbi:MAG: hypothetical protein H7Y04_05590, partial [Verrucomicrobia bacterium]|nr:hypothetical protein [Cytophagales bacterium]
MRKLFSGSLFFLLALLTYQQAFSQCATLQRPSATTPVSCRFGSDGTITVRVNPGDSTEFLILQRFNPSLGSYVDVAGPVPVLVNNQFTFTGLVASNFYRVILIDGDDANCLGDVEDFIQVRQPNTVLALTIDSKTEVMGCFGDAN